MKTDRGIIIPIILFVAFVSLISLLQNEGGTGTTTTTTTATTTTTIPDVYAPFTGRYTSFGYEYMGMLKGFKPVTEADKISMKAINWTYVNQYQNKDNKMYYSWWRRKV